MKKSSHIGGALVAAALLLFASATIHAEDWLQWGGPRGDFMVPSGALAESWPASGPRRLWERPLGPGFSSILVTAGKLVTMYREGDDELVAALDARTGATLWTHRDRPTLWPEMTKEFGLGPNGTPLIIKDGGDRVVAIGISGKVRCLDLDKGTLLWSRDLQQVYGRKKRVEEYGYSASPLPYDGRVIIQAGGPQAAVVALDPKDGAVRWKSAPGGVSYANATLTRLAGRTQYIYFEPEGIVALDPASGVLLWRFPIEFNNGNHLTPAVPCGEDHLWVGSQFDTGGGRLLRISSKDGALRAEQVWFDAKMAASHWTLIPVGDFIYGSIGGNGRSAVKAFRWKTGEVAWSDAGFHKTQALMADGKYLFLDEKGWLVLARVSPAKMEVLARTQLTGKRFWTLPTLVSATLYVRDEARIMALDLGRP